MSLAVESPPEEFGFLPLTVTPVDRGVSRAAALARRFLTFSRWCAAAVVSIGAVDLLGWKLQIVALVRVLPTGAVMSPNTAFCLVLGGISALLLERDGAGWRRTAAVIGGSTMTLVGLATAAQYLLGKDIGLAGILFAGTPRFPGVGTERMSVISTLVLAALGTSIVLCARRVSHRIARGLIALCGLIALIAISGYSPGFYGLDSFGPYERMAFHTAVGFFVLSAGLSFSLAGRGFLAFLAAPGAGGVVVRRLLPVAVVAPTLLMWARGAGQSWGTYGAEYGSAIFTGINAVAFVALIAWVATTLERADAVGRRERDARSRLAEIVESSSDAIISRRIDGVITSWNGGAERLFGYSPSEALNNRLGVHLPPDRESELEDILRRVHAGEKVAHYETVRIRKDGSRVEVSLTVSPVFDASGAIVGASAIARDITERRRADEELRQSERYVRNILDNIAGSVGIFTPEGVFLDGNRARIIRAGVEIEDVIGMEFAEIYAFRDSAASQRQVRDIFRRVKMGERVTEDLHVRIGEGDHVDMSATFVPIRDADGRVITVVGSGFDVTERNRAMEALRETDTRLRMLHRAANIGSWEWDLVSNAVYFSPEWKAQIGFQDSEINDVFEEWSSRIHPEDLEATLAKARASIASSDGQYEAEFRFRHKNGGFRWINAQGQALPNPEGKRVRMLGCHIDVTDRKEAELATRERERILSESQRIAHIGSWIWEISGAIRVSPEIGRIYGVGPEFEWNTASFLGLVEPADRPLVQRWYAGLVEGRNPGEAAFRAKMQDGTGRNIRAHGELVRDPAGMPFAVVGTSQDVTEREGAARALRDSEERYRSIVEQTSAWICTHDLGGTLLSVNRRVAEIIGWDPARIAGGNVRDLLEPGFRDRFEDYVAEVWATGASAGLMTVVSRDGSPRTLEYHAMLRKEGPSETVVQVIALDVTDRVESDRARKKLEARLEHVVSASPATTYLLSVDPLPDPTMRIAWISSNVERLLGYSSTECREPFWWRDRLHPEDREEAIAAGIRTLETTHVVREYRFRHADGSYRWMQDEQRLLKAPSDTPGEIVGSWSDITAHRALEEQLRQAQKMEAVGRLAGGIAHDFNNLLMVVQAAADIIPFHAEDPAAWKHDLQSLTTAAQRGGDLTRQLIAFSRTGVGHKEIVDPASVVSTLAPMIETLLGASVELALDARNRSGTVRMDRSQLEQIVMNLVVNARDAMPSGGRLSIRVEGIRLDADEAAERPGLGEGPYIRITVEDTGTGMSSAVQARLFEPFFTTKELGRGTGLGLATVYGIVESANGEIRVRSEPGNGSCFQVYLPVAEGSVAAPGPAADLGNSTRHLTVLVVEDEATILEMIDAFLTTLGHHVLTASDGHRALALLASESGTIDVLVTDIVLPGPGGRQVAQAALARDPRTRVIFMSGYSDDTTILESIEAGSSEFLQKPFRLEALAGKVLALKRPAA